MHGVGGRTIAEAKEAMTYAEAMRWFEYVRRRGSLNIGRRIECSVALLATMWNRANGGQLDMADFMPHEDAPVATVEDIAKALGARVR